MIDIKQLNKETCTIGLVAGFKGKDWNLLDANCLMEVVEFYRMHTYENVSNKKKWVAAYKDIRGNGDSIIFAQLDCLSKLIDNEECNGKTNS